MASPEEEQIEQQNVSVGLSELYISHYRDHVSKTNAQLSGIDGDPLPASLLLPRAKWSPHEKSAFFHALTIHSRLRPDLIAASVKTKTTVDVCIYLDLLEEAAKSAPAPPPAPASLDASDVWIALEERSAAALVAAEPGWEHTGREKARGEELRLSRNSQRARRGAGPKERDYTAERERAERWEAWRDEREAEWAREDMLREMGMNKLEVVDATLKDDEDLESQPTEPTEHRLPGNDVPIDPALLAPQEHTMVDPALLPDAPASSSRSLSTPPPDPAALPSDPALSPASRRRLYKRMHMRRKRAERRGEAAPAAAAKLKPGRRPKKDAAEEEEESSEHESEDGRRSGLVSRQKLRTLFGDLGLDADALRERGMGLFNNAELGRLIELYAALHPDCTPASLSSEVVHALCARLVELLVNVVPQVVVTAEQARAAEGRTKAWRPAVIDEVTAEDVELALDTIGLPRTRRTTRVFFEELPARLDLDINESADSGSDSDAGEDSRAAKCRRVEPPLESGVYAPFLRLPAAYRDVDPEDLMPEETDEEALEAELREEEELDARDIEEAKGAEEALWAAYRREEDVARKRKRREVEEEGGSEDEEEDEPARAGRDRLRFGAPRGRVKSQVYVEDSD